MRQRSPGAAVTAAASRFAFWRLGLWLVLLLAAFGAMQYGVHAYKVWSVLAATVTDAEGRQALHTMLAWDTAYFVVAAAMVVLCAAGILRQGWARPALRASFLALSLWLAVNGVLLYRQWTAWLALQAGVAEAAALVQQQARQVHLALGFDVVAVVVLLGLAWRLGRPEVAAQFRRRGTSR